MESPTLNAPFITEDLPVDVPGAPDCRLAVRLTETDAAGDVAILYLHGFGSSQSGTKADFFRRRAGEAGLAFCSFDFRGHGASDGGMLELTLSRNLEDVACVHGLLRERGYQRIVLMGSSMGGGSALWYAALHSDDIVAAVHIAPSLTLEEGLLAAVGEEGAGRWREEGKVTFSHELVTCELGWGLIEDLRRYPMGRLQELYRTPTLLFQGKHDASVPWQKAVDFTVGCRHDPVELHLMADADHRMIDRLDHLWRLSFEFLALQGLATRSP